MSSEKDLGNLDSRQWDRLNELVRKFEQACAAGKGAALADHLPAPGDPVRLVTLHELIKSDLEHSWRQKTPRLLDHYLKLFPELGSASSLPTQLIYEEYLTRKKYGDQPDLVSYKERFPDQYDEVKTLAQDTDHPSLTKGDDEGSGQGLAARLKEEMVLPIGGGYRLIKRLGRGNFGQVWKAEAPGGRHVALKILDWPEDHPAAQRERQSLELIKQFNHPYLLDIHAFHSLENALVIVARLADGNLADRLKECKRAGLKGIPPAELLKYIAETAEVLDYLNGRSIQHRDIKPENLLMLQGHVAVGDLGLARLLERQQVQASVLGTPPYMAPEVWLHKIHSNTDQYSLAITYLELRCGKCPFKTANMEGLQPQHIKEAPDLEPLKESERIVLLRAGNVDPEKRFPSCQAFVDALEQATQAVPSVTIYQKIKRIGKGAFGEVWKGEAPGGVPVAIKVIPLGNEEKGKSEIQALELIKGLAHPYLVKVHACWMEEADLHIAMELMERSLGQRLNECRRQKLNGIPRDELLGYFRQSAEGLDFLHSNQILHRDIKPENILLQGRFAKIADFGVAKVIQDRQLFTATTSGTMAYMPPEAWRGKYSVHSDQYSLAAAYAETRLGHRLFTYDNPADAMDAHLTRQPQLAPLPPSEQRVLQRALAKRPEDRYPSCLEFVDELIEAAKAVPLPPPGGDDSKTIIPGTDFCDRPELKTDVEGLPPPPPSSVTELKRPSTDPNLPRLSSKVPEGSQTAREIAAKVAAVRPPSWHDPKALSKKEKSPGKINVALALLILVGVLGLAAGSIYFLTRPTTPELVDVTIASIPPGATVYLDGKLQSTKAGGIFPLAPGRYQVRLELPEFKTLEKEIEITRDSSSQKVDLTLVKSETGKIPDEVFAVTIKTQPKDAKVYLDGVLQNNVAETPLKLAANDYQLKLVLDNKHYIFNKKIAIPKDKVIEHTFEPITITIKSNEAGAKIIINNKEEVGKTTPAVIPLEEGNYKIEVAKDKFYPVEPKLVVVSAEKPLSPIEFILKSMPEPKAETRYALLIGVHQTNPNAPEFPDFLHAEPDVEELGRTLIAGGFDKDKVQVLTQSRAANSKGLAPTKATILAELKNLEAKCHPKDVVVVAFAGPQIKFANGPNQGTYFCPDKSSVANVDSLVPMKEVFDILAKCQAAEKLVFLDGWQHCWQKPPLPVPPVPVMQRRAKEAVPAKVRVLFACAPGEESFDHQTIPHGTFFYFVSRGLQGEADDVPGGNNDGVVSLKELGDYVEQQTTNYIKTVYPKENQKPDRQFGSGADDVKVVKLSPGLKQFNEGVQKSLQFHEASQKAEKDKKKLDDAEKKKLDEAIALFDEAEKPLPEFVEVYVQRAKAQFARGNEFLRNKMDPQAAKEYEKVIKDCELALKYDPFSAAAYGFMADAHALTGTVLEKMSKPNAKDEFNKALQKHDEAILLEPQYSGAFFARALTYRDQGNLKMAINDFEKAISLNPYLEKPHRGLIQAHIKNANYPKAFEAAEEALRTDPSWTEVKKLHDSLKKLIGS